MSGKRVSLAEYARLHDVSRKTVTRWRAAGHLKIAGKKVEVDQSDDRLKELGLGRFRHAEQTETWADARRRKEVALAQKHELDVQERIGRLITIDAFREAHARLLDTVRTNILNIEGRWATHFPGCTPREASAVLRQIANELLEHLSGPAADSLERDGPVTPEPRLPENFPGRSVLSEVGIDSLSKLLEVENLQSIHGIGPVTERKIQEAIADVG